MSHEEKINYMRIACGICGYGFQYEQMDLLVSVYELVIEKKGDTDLKALSEVESYVKKRANIKARQEALDKVSKNVKEE